MAMTKKEQAEFQAAIDRADTLAALRWTAPVERDVFPPKDGYTEGWDFNSYTKTAHAGWSSSIHHGTGPAPQDSKRHYTASQNPRRMFSTKAKALAALRHEVEKNTAADLLAIDRQIIAATQDKKDNT